MIYLFKIKDSVVTKNWYVIIIISTYFRGTLQLKQFVK
jgi:hypothetical protein